MVVEFDKLCNSSAKEDSNSSDSLCMFPPAERVVYASVIPSNLTVILLFTIGLCYSVFHFSETRNWSQRQNPQKVTSLRRHNDEIVTAHRRLYHVTKWRHMASSLSLYSRKIRKQICECKNCCFCSNCVIKIAEISLALWNIIHTYIF